MKKKQLLWRLNSGAKNNVRFKDFMRLIEAFGFVQLRQRGSHMSFAHRKVAGLLVIQERNGQAIPYQIETFLAMVEENGLSMETEDDD